MAPRRKSTRLSTAHSASSSKVATPDPILAPRSRGRPRKSLPVPEAEIPDSDDIGDLITITSAQTTTFQGIFLPPVRNATTQKSASTATPSIADSLDSASDGNPDSSAMTTPAGQDMSNTTKRGRISATSRAKELQASVLSLNSALNNRKRTRRGLDSVETQSVDENADAQMAARLQAEEYGETDDSDAMPLMKRRKKSMVVGGFSNVSNNNHHADAMPGTSRTQRRSIQMLKQTRTIMDSDDELSFLSDILDSQDEDEDEDFATSSRPKARLPIRRARSAKRAAPPTTDMRSLPSLSDDLSVLSESPVDDFSGLSDDEDSEDSEASDEDESNEIGISTTTKLSIQGNSKAVGKYKKLSKRAHLPTRYGLSRQEWDSLGPRGRRTKRERTRLEKAHPEIRTMWDDLASVDTIKPVAAPQPAGISRKLKGFQLEGLDWMIRQEQTHYKGGLLGDEMGMGKTIQAVSLIMSDFPAKNPTLVVVPPVALMQWQSEITDYTSGKLKILVYHVSANPKCKLLTPKDLKKYNVIMVSYSGLESMYRKETKGWTRGDGLVKEDSILHSIKYHRLILDEAHSIKQRTTSVAKACFALRANYRWCLSGTPVQNRIGEFFSLLRFLEVQPFACYFCKECDCKELHWSQDQHRMCNHCHHSGFNHVSVFNQEILNPIIGDSDAARKQGLAKLRLITDRIMLRRMKRDHTSSMELPPKDVVLHREFFGEMEKDFSSSIMLQTARRFDTYVAQGVMLNNYANIFGLIMQMRQVANHPDLLLRRKAQGAQNVLVCCICDEPAEEAIRSKCRHEFCRECAKNYVRSFGGESGDADCPQCHIALEIDWDQPDIEQDEETVKKNSIINRIKMENWTSSTKIEMLVYDLYKLRSKKQTHKSIVFSQFTSMLQLVQWRLQKSGFSTVLLDGSMSPAQRQKSIDHFMNNVDVEVFLVSLKAGGVALNLTEASRVFIIDPWWNPAAEWQSADRCHRIGQRRPCIITRLCIEDSVESRMVLLQEKKANMINGTVNGDQVALDKLTPEDMQFLFRGS